MSLTNDDVRRVAALARIAITADESAEVLERLNRVLALIDEMRSVDVSGVEPMAHAQELGQRLREDKVTRTGIVVVHQPRAALSYLGLDSMTALTERTQTPAQLTTPYDDGIPDLPPGIVDVGHLHEPNGPWVVWNTEGDAITWTVVDQLGTAGGVENAPTFSRFSTPVSPPLKPVMVRLQYVNKETGLQTGYVTVECDLNATCTVSDRVDVGLPGGKPRPTAGTAVPTPGGGAPLSTGGTTGTGPGPRPGR